MSNSLIWIIVIIVALTILGSLALGSVTIFYYWGARGAPPPTGEQKRLLKEQQERAAQKRQGN